MSDPLPSILCNPNAIGPAATQRPSMLGTSSGDAERNAPVWLFRPSTEPPRFLAQGVNDGAW